LQTAELRCRCASQRLRREHRMGGPDHSTPTGRACCAARTIRFRAVVARRVRSAWVARGMAAGTPVVASDIEGCRNVARADSTRCWSRPGDVSAFCSTRCAKCSTTGDAATRLVAAGRERQPMIAHGSSLPIGNLEIYERILSRPDDRDPIFNGSRSISRRGCATRSRPRSGNPGRAVGSGRGSLWRRHDGDLRIAARHLVSAAGSGRHRVLLRDRGTWRSARRRIPASSTRSTARESRGPPASRRVCVSAGCCPVARRERSATSISVVVHEITTGLRSSRLAVKGAHVERADG